MIGCYHMDVVGKMLEIKESSYGAPKFRSVNFGFKFDLSHY